MSKALALRNAALHLVARDGRDLDLADAAKLADAAATLVAGALDASHDVLLLGATNQYLVGSIMRGARQRGCALTVIEPQPDLLAQAISLDTDEASGSTKFITCDPTDLKIDPSGADELIAAAKPKDFESYRALAQQLRRRADASPLIQDCSLDLVVIDMLVNRLDAEDAARVLAEAFRVLRRGGRIVSLALLADEPLEVPSKLDFGCCGLEHFPVEADAGAGCEAAGYHGTSYHALRDRPEYVLAGIELRAFAIEAYKGKQGACVDQGHAVIYRGPWREVRDDDGHRFVRGQRAAVCAKTYELMMRAPYAQEFVGVPPYAAVPLDRAPPFDCNTPALRHAAVTKGRILLDARQPDEDGCTLADAPKQGVASSSSGCC